LAIRGSQDLHNEPGLPELQPISIDSGSSGITAEDASALRKGEKLRENIKGKGERCHSPWRAKDLAGLKF